MILGNGRPRGRFWIAAIVVLLTSTAWTCGQWSQWGGPDRNFDVEAGPIAVEWPEAGPATLWERPLGDGFSAILIEGNRLFTARRDGDKDVIVSLDAGTGKTLWETSYESPTAADMILDFGPGPITTPLLVGDRLFTVSSVVKFHCLDKNDGKILWSRDLRQEMQASHLGRGFGASPIAYKDTVILTVGGPEHAVVAFDQKTGETVWQSQSFPPGYSSPILIDFQGEPLLLVSMGNHRAGLDPATGALKWHLELPRGANMMSTLQYGEDELLFGSGAYADGSRVIQLSKAGGEVQAHEIWYSRKMRVMYASVIRIGDYVYASSGDFGPAFLMGINVKTGDVAWRRRGFGRANLLHADGKLVILDEEGDLAVATATPEALTVHCRANVIGRTAWTPPTLVGSKLYVRNREVIKAIDLAPAAAGDE